LDRSDTVRAVIGLGNPGKRYAGTRHNVGFDVIDKLAGDLGADVTRRRFNARIGEAVCGGERVVLVKPQTFMNDSGRAVQGVVAWHKLALDELLVVCDDLDIEFATLRLRRKGSSGGHKGLKSIARMLGGTEFPRLRIGVGRPPSDHAIDFVLSRFGKAEREQIDEAVDRAAEAVQTWIIDGIDASMNRFN
jgi:PTH1 family peptidyl-tRNA hydrolase